MKFPTPCCVFLVGLMGCNSAPAKTPSFATADAPAAAPAEWHDASPHTSRLVKVAPDVTLEVLDWGGSGAPLVFLTGLGNSAHVYDEFAPQFTDHFHVVAITRRGFGASSQPTTGYDIETRTADLLAVLDALAMPRVTLVGHSVAGDELTGFAARHGERVARLIYLEAAYDHLAFLRATENVPALPDPPMTPADSASLRAYMAHYAALGDRFPESEWRATSIFDTAGRFVRDRTPDAITTAVLHGAERPPYSKVRAPALAIYKLWESPESIKSPEWWARLDAANRDKATKWWRAVTKWGSDERQLFRREMGKGRVVELSNVHHYVWSTHHEQVVTAMRAFLSEP